MQIHPAVLHELGKRLPLDNLVRLGLTSKSSMHALGRERIAEASDAVEQADVFLEALRLFRHVVAHPAEDPTAYLEAHGARSVYRAGPDLHFRYKRWSVVVDHNQRALDDRIRYTGAPGGWLFGCMLGIKPHRESNTSESVDIFRGCARPEVLREFAATLQQRLRAKGFGVDNISFLL